jgi:hypothetical protein
MGAAVIPEVAAAEQAHPIGPSDMDTNLLRSWLGLPPGPWPPDDRELLGFGLEAISPEEVELRALERMEKLRPHQLVNPELTTEGMNRLAQALIALTAPQAAKTTDGTAKVAPPEPPPKPKRRRPHRHPKPPESPAPVVSEAESILEAELVVEEPAPPQPGVFLPPESVSREPIVASEVPQRPVEIAQPVGLAIPAKRREGYQTLVRWRKWRRDLDQLRPFFADPGEQVLTPLRVFEYIRSIRDFRKNLRIKHGPKWPVQHGQLVLAIVEHPYSLTVFRELLPSQRQALAADWALAVQELNSQYAIFRNFLNTSKPSHRLQRKVRSVQTWLRENPEWLLAAVVALAFVVAVARTALQASQ